MFLKDSLGHFPLLPSLENFRTDFEESNFASEIQADVLPGLCTRSMSDALVTLHSHYAELRRLLCGEPAFICLLFAELNRTATQQNLMPSIFLSCSRLVVLLLL